MTTFRLSGKTSQLTLNLEHPIHLDAEYKLALTGLFCEYNFYNLFEGCSVLFDGGTKIGFGKGFWTFDAIQKHIQKGVDPLLRGKTDDKKNKVTVVSILKTTGYRVKITSPIKFHMENPLRRLLGFDEIDAPEYLDTYNAKKPHNIRPWDMIEVHCDIVENCFVNHDEHWHKHKESSVLYSFFPYGEFGNKIAVMPRPPLYVSLKKGLNKIQQINIYITDQNNNLLQMFDSNVHIYLELIRV